MEPPWQRRLAVKVTKDAERHIRAGHPWVFDRSVESAKPGGPGDLAVIFDHERRFLAIGLYDPTSPLSIRILHTGKPQTIDAQWLVEAIGAAIERRRPLLDKAASGETTAFRLVHGENDGLGGLVIDQYGSNLVLKLYTVAWLPWLDHLVEAARTAAGGGDPATGGRVDRVVLRLSRQVAAGGSRSDGEVLIGSVPDGPVTFAENGLHFQADLIHGHKTGHFLDQRDNRRMIGSLAAGLDVLDVFACTGGFSVHAAAGGAATVMSVDASRPALNSAKANMALNPATAATTHQTRAGDAFAVLENLVADGAEFGLIVVDPPAFAQRRSQVPGALSAYERLASLAGRLAAPGGLILQASCSSRIDDDQLVGAVASGLRRAGRTWSEVRRTGQPIDHPIGFAQGRYLKAVLVEAG
ncbi:MAG: class I SAM-dependent rRNA methyltransferase [Acidimicrobiia bacterium]|nr:class I SAM-dependent rRNA methyltransferase [Acidimicrobiia bacterium]MDH5520320.1 class I SAM-dependent rRNA methyltransferase [Acidimicrobiia bacterium]